MRKINEILTLVELVSITMLNMMVWAALMISEKGRQFLMQFILNDDLEQQIQRLTYSDRVTVALDLQRLVKQLVKEIEDKTGENLFATMFEDVQIN